MPSPFQITSRDSRVQPHDFDSYRGAQHGVTVAGGFNSTDVSAALTTLAATGGQNAQPVPNVAATDINTQGWATGALSGVCPINNEQSNAVPAAGGKEIYARFTNVGAAYTLTYFVNDGAGGDTATQLPAGNWVIQVPYLHSYETWPWDAAFRSSKTRISQDAASSSQPAIEHLAIAVLNTIPALAAAPRAGTYVELLIGGRSFFSNHPTPVFTIAGTAITYLSLVSSMDLFVGDTVSVKYVV